MLVKFTAGARVALALALATAGAGALAAGTRWTAIAACVLAAVAVALLVLARFGPVDRLSWLDAAMGASSTAALAVALGAGRRRAVAVGGVAGVLALSPLAAGPAGRSLALAGLAALGAGEGLAARRAALVGARRVAAAERPPEPGPEFSPVVLAAILTFATIALALLTVGQFTEIADVADRARDRHRADRHGPRRADRRRAPARDAARRRMTDDLTGLGNRRHLVDPLARRDRVGAEDAATSWRCC